jgi:AcrR family transcriptional regulator
MNPNRREKKRTAALEEIRATAWKQISEMGLQALSLRGIAREMGVTAPALYRYYADRDALVIALLADAFTSFTIALETGRDACNVDDYAGRVRAMCKSYFQWAVQNPQRYTLMFGTTIPRQLFAQELGPIAQRSFLVLQGVVGEAHKAGKIVGELTTLRLPTQLKAQYEALKKMGMPYSPLVTHLALAVWSMMHGITSLYLYQYLSGFLAENVESFVDFEIEKIVRMLGVL